MSTRRGFLGNVARLPLLVAVGSTFSSTACWLTGSLFNQILGYVNVGLQAFQTVVSLLDPPLALAAAAVIAAVKAGFADLQTAVNDYNAAPAADKTTLKNKIAVVIADLQNEIQNFWSNLNLPDGSLATLIQGLLAVILSTLAGFAGQLPVPVGAKPRTATKVIPVTPAKRSKKQFENDFNAVLVAAGKPAVKF